MLTIRLTRGLVPLGQRESRERDENHDGPQESTQPNSSSPTCIGIASHRPTPVLRPPLRISTPATASKMTNKVMNKP